MPPSDCRSESMDKALQAVVAALGNEVRAAAVPDSCKHTAAWCLGRLPPLYARLRQTNESRYGDEITRLVHAALKALDANQGVCPEGQRLAARIADRLRLLHEE